MPYDEALAERVRVAVGRRRGFVERRMFGGVGFLLHGHMCLGVWKHWLIARIGPDGYEAALERPHVAEFDITGRPMRGWVMIDAAGAARDADLIEWAEMAVQFVRSLPAKPAK